jgi:hypothetical protein
MSESEIKSYGIGDVQETKQFFCPDVKTYLCRNRLMEIVKAKRHWVFALSGPEVAPIALRLNQLHVERCDDGIEMLVLSRLPSFPAFFIFPRDHLDFDEIPELLGFDPGPREVVKSKAYMTVASERIIEQVSLEINVWVNIEHLVN